MNYNVTVIGAGRMGSALATVVFHKGFATTVWNRTGAKTEVLSRLGLSVAQSLEESVREADIVVVSVRDYSSTRELLRQPDIETALPKVEDSEFARTLYGLTPQPRFESPSLVTSRVPSPLAAYRMPACHGRRTDCLPVRPLVSTCARCDHRRRRNTHLIRAS